MNVTLESLHQAVTSLDAVKDKVALYTFTGPLGAGKTTLIGALLAQWGVAEPVVSPTFSLLNIYTNAQGERFYHFDLYRLGGLEEFVALGFHEYLYAPSAWCLIEWPESIEPLLKGRVCRVSLDYGDHNERILDYTLE